MLSKARDLEGVKLTNNTVKIYNSYIFSCQQQGWETPCLFN